MLLSRQFVGRYDLASEYSRTTSTPQTTKAHIETTDTVIRTQLVAVWPRRPPTPPEDPSPTSFAMTTEHAVAMVTYGVTSCQVTHPIWRLSDARMSLRKHGKWRCVCVCARARVWALCFAIGGDTAAAAAHRTSALPGARLKSNPLPFSPLFTAFSSTQNVQSSKDLCSCRIKSVLLKMLILCRKKRDFGYKCSTELDGRRRRGGTDSSVRNIPLKTSWFSRLTLHIASKCKKKSLSV